MKTFVLASILGAFAFSAAAQTTGNSETVTISGAKAGASQQVRTMSPDEFNRFSGSYELSNGQSLALFTRGLKKYAALHGEAWHELVATSSNSFVSKDKQLQMTIDVNESGEVRGELLMVVPDRLAGGGSGGTRTIAFH